jgi:hypothetical protein
MHNSRGIKIPFLMTAVFIFCAMPARAQTIQVNPTGVNVNSQNTTTAFLTFGQIPAGYVPAEAIWCGELVPATLPALGLACRPGTIYGSLPLRYDRSQNSGNGGFTDIMSIPPSVVRRAYQAAVRGASAGFFYVRRFVSTNGGPDQFVNVTCRMTGGGARVPFALTEVELKTPDGEPILFLKKGEPFPIVRADIHYNGTGRLKGRWEIVQPGEEPPADKDLLTEATLPIEQRADQKRYTTIARFDHFLPPSEKFTLTLENPERLPLTADGQYLLLLRVEAVDDKESDSDLAAVGVGPGVVHSGAVAGFPLPTLRFFYGGDARTLWQSTALLSPGTEAAVRPVVFTWRELQNASIYRIDLLAGSSVAIFSAMLPANVRVYRAPSWLTDRFAGRSIGWRVTALDDKGQELSRTNTRAVKF